MEMKHRFMTITAFAAGTLLLMAGSAQAAPHGGGHHGGGGFHHGGAIVVGGPWWGWGWGWGYPGYYGYGYGPYGYYGAGYGYGNHDGNWGAVKTDVDPEEARVYLDGKYIGAADDFDGWPDKLYLRPGRYRLEFRLSGYEPKVLDVEVHPGQELKIDNKLPHGGTAVSTQADPPRIEGDVQRYFGKRRSHDRRPYGRDYEHHGADSRGMDAYPEDQDMGEGNYEGNDDAYGDQAPPAQVAPRPQAPAPAPAPSRDESWRNERRPADASVSARAESRRDRARLKITAEPSDAVVYVDDRFVGSADEITSMDRGIVVAPGKHTITVSRPGYRDMSREVTVDATKTVTVEMSLVR